MASSRSALNFMGVHSNVARTSLGESLYSSGHPVFNLDYLSLLHILFSCIQNFGVFDYLDSLTQSDGSNIRRDEFATASLFRPVIARDIYSEF